MQRKLLVSIRNTLRGLTIVDFLGFMLSIFVSYVMSLAVLEWLIPKSI